MPLWALAAIKFIADLVARVVNDWRRDAALIDAGRDAQKAETNQAAAEAERRAASVSDGSISDAIDDLDRGKF